jgi:endoglucanase
MPLPDLLRQLLTAAGPSGYETAPAAVFAQAGRAFTDDVEIDVMGSAVARVAGTADPAGPAPFLAIVGHIDEIGLIVTHIDDNGFLRFIGVGGWDPQILVGQRVELITRDGTVASRSTCCARRIASASPSCATCTSTSARRTATRRAGSCASATSR